MKWTITQKILFRFLTCYLFLFIMSNQFVLSFATDWVWQKIVPWFAETFMNLPEKITVFTNGSGDTTYNYVSLICYAIVAVVATLIWSILDKKRDNYSTLLQWMLALIRYYLIYQMLIYGLAKVFYLQFQPPRLTRLVQAYGDSSPMGILWTFMGQSKGYTIFAGVGEIIGGLLLFSRRTTTIGALVVFGVMSNVMALNYFYDVPVKILSTHIVFLSLVLLVLNYKRLVNIFFLNRATEKKIYPPYFKNIKWEKIRRILKWVVILGWLGYSIYETADALKLYGPNVERPKNYGLYEVEMFALNGDTIPPLATDSIRWKNFIVEYKGRGVSHAMTNKRQWYNMEEDSLGQYFMMRPSRDTLPMDTLYFSKIDSLHFQMNGVLRGDTLDIYMRRKNKADFLLRNRGFRWVNEYPFNR